MKIDVEAKADPDYQRTMDTIATSLVEVARGIESVNVQMGECQRLLMDIARNYRNALGRRASLYVADGVDGASRGADDT